QTGRHVLLLAGEPRELLPCRLLGDDDDAMALAEAPARRPRDDAHDSLDHVAIDRLRQVAANHAPAAEQVAEVAHLTPTRSWRAASRRGRARRGSPPAPR